SVTSLTLSAPVAGGAITADWPPVADASVVGYRLYWGTSSGNYSDYQDLGMVLTHTVGGLTNNVEYYFNLTSYYATMAESEYYGEVSETPQDTESPAVPVNLVANAGDGQIELSWDANIDDTVGYIVYYGTNTLVYGASHDVGNTTSAVITGLTGGEIYYFAVSAYDSYTNESPQSAEATAIPTP
ncbi:MAG: fibronectin type III domain-containing protein, partial [Candidatus Falkowbacteria bacterium]